MNGEWKHRVLRDWIGGRTDTAITKIVIAIEALRKDSHPPQPIADVVNAVLDERASLITPERAKGLKEVRRLADELEPSVEHLPEPACSEVYALIEAIRAAQP